MRASGASSAMQSPIGGRTINGPVWGLLGLHPRTLNLQRRLPAFVEECNKAIVLCCVVVAQPPGGGATLRNSGDARPLDTTHTSGGRSLLRIAARTLSRLQQRWVTQTRVLAREGVGVGGEAGQGEDGQSIRDNKSTESAIEVAGRSMSRHCNIG